MVSCMSLLLPIRKERQRVSEMNNILRAVLREMSSQMRMQVITEELTSEEKKELALDWIRLHNNLRIVTIRDKSRD